MSAKSGMFQAERGIVYVAIRPRFVEEARISARSVKAFLPDIPILLFTDSLPSDTAMFDEIIVLAERSRTPHLDKLVGMKLSPFRDTLFLDTDTYVCAPPSGLFDLLGPFDMAMALERRYVDAFPAESDVPASFGEYNQGVIAYRQSTEMQHVFQQALDWSESFYERTGRATDDQVALRIALYRSRLRVAPLAQEYNCRFHAFGWLNGTVKILHGRIPGAQHNAANLQRIAQRLNSRTIPRVYVAGRVYALERLRLRGVDHYFARRTATLFRPWRAMAQRLVEAARRRLR